MSDGIRARVPFCHVVLNECQENWHEPDDLTRKKDLRLACFSQLQREMVSGCSSQQPFKRSHSTRSSNVLYTKAKNEKTSRARRRRQRGRRRYRRLRYMHACQLSTSSSGCSVGNGAKSAFLFGFCRPYLPYLVLPSPINISLNPRNFSRCYCESIFYRIYRYRGSEFFFYGKEQTYSPMIFNSPEIARCIYVFQNIP